MTSPAKYFRCFVCQKRGESLRGFTVVELLMVIVIIGILISLLLPAVQMAREAARRGQCTNNLKQLATGCLNHESAIKTFPTNGWAFAFLGHPDRGVGISQPGGWIYNILPYIEQDSLYRGQAGLTGGSLQTAAATLMQTPVPPLYCPSRRPPALYPNLAVKIDDPIGDTQTLFVVPWLGGNGQTVVLNDAGATTRVLANNIAIVCRNDYAGNGFDYVDITGVATKCVPLATALGLAMTLGPKGAGFRTHRSGPSGDHHAGYCGYAGRQRWYLLPVKHGDSPRHRGWFEQHLPDWRKVHEPERLHDRNRAR